MYIGQARVIVSNAEGYHLFKRNVYIGETSESVLDEAKNTFSMFVVVSLKIKWYFNSEVRKHMNAEYSEISPDRTLALWIES